MLNKQILFRLITLLLVFCLVLISISNRGCPKRSKSRAGSSNKFFTINAPSGLTAIAVSPYQINLSWTDNSNNDSGFEIERKMWAGGTWIQIATTDSEVTVYSDFNLLPTTTYYYRVRAFNDLGDRSDYSNEAEATTLNLTWSMIAAGENHTIVRSMDGILWSWGRNENGQLGLGDTEARLVANQIETTTDWSTVACGAYHTLAIKLDNTLWSWGASGLGQTGMGDTELDNLIPFQVGDNSDWVKIAGGRYHSMAIKENGTIHGWGYNSDSQLGLLDNIIRMTPSQIGIDTDWFAVTCGEAYTSALKNNRTIWAWGLNDNGQLGDGTTVTRSTPRSIGSDSDWSALTAGWLHTSAIKTSRTLWMWGDNLYGQLGLGDTIDRNTPTQIGTESSWIMNAAGYRHTLGCKANGTIWSCGNNAQGQLGIGNSEGGRNTLSQIGTDTDWSVAACGGYHSLAMKSNGTLWSWGYNNYGQLGLWDTNIRVTPTQTGFLIPAPPSNLVARLISSTQVQLTWLDNSDNESGFKIERKIGNSGSYEQLITVSVDINSYIDNEILPLTTYYYRLKAYNGSGDSPYSNEVYVTLSGNWSIVSAGWAHTIGLKNNGTIWSWGYNNYGQLGLDDTNSRNTPTQIDSALDWLAIATVGVHSIGLKSNGTIWTWGINSSGELGLGDSLNRKTPAQIASISDWAKISAGGNHTLAIKNDSTLWGWGYNSEGQLGVGDSNNRNTPTQIGSYSDWVNSVGGVSHSLGRRSNGTIWSWGRNDEGQLGLGNSGLGTDRNTPTQVGNDSDWSYIGAGDNHTIATKNNGTIWSWGRNEFGQLGLGNNGSGTYRNTPSQIGIDSDWSVVKAGYEYTIACKINGTIWSWGSNGVSGKLGLGDTDDRTTPSQIGTDSDWSMITAGGSHVLARKTNNTLWAWGYNIRGQLGLGDTMQRDTPTMVGE